MDNGFTKITFTYPMCYDRPSSNGITYTKEAIIEAFRNADFYKPITLDDNNVIGFTTSTYHFDWDEENKVCNATIEGYLFDTAPCLRINKMINGIISDCDIMSMSILTQGGAPNEI